MVRLLGIALALLAFAASLESRAQSYPVKPIHLIVPGTPGGDSDLLARMVSQKAGSTLGQPVVVENRTGAYGIIGAELLAHSAPDGYTLLLGNGGTNVANLFLHKNLPYDPVKDFAPITGGIESIMCIAANPAAGFSSIREFIDHAKRNPGKLTYASSGSGGSYYLAGEAFQAMTGTRIMHVPYKGLSQAMNDLVAGQVSSAFTNVTVALPQEKAGKVRILAVLMANRYSGLPSVPTVNEVVPGFRPVAIWNGFFGRAGMPAAAVARLNAEFNKAMNSPEVSSKMDAGLLIGGSPEQFAAYVRDQTEAFAGVAKLLQLKPE